MMYSHLPYLTIVIALSRAWLTSLASSTDALCVEEHVLTVEYRQVGTLRLVPKLRLPTGRYGVGHTRLFSCVPYQHTNTTALARVAQSFSQLMLHLFNMFISHLQLYSSYDVVGTPSDWTHAGLVSSKLSALKSSLHLLMIGRNVESNVLSCFTISSSCDGSRVSSLPPNAAIKALRLGMAVSDSGNIFFEASSRDMAKGE